MSDIESIIAEIEKAMEHTTPGPWHPGCIVDDTSACNCHSVCTEGYESGIATATLGNGLPLGKGGIDGPGFEECKANTAYIAACNPKNMRAILTRLKDADTKTIELEERVTEAQITMREIADADAVDNMLDPQRPARIARKWLGEEAT